MRRRVSCSLALAVLLGGTSAAASPAYPGDMKTDLGLTRAPGCDLCHASAAAPVGPVSTEFGQSIVARGLVADDPASLSSALTRMSQDGVDSDGDGARDLDELSWGGDPNHADLPQAGYQDPVSYGCSASGDRRGFVGAWLGLGLLIAWATRRRARG